MQIEQIGIGQLHWSTANYAPLQERALWDGLVAMYDKVTNNSFGITCIFFIWDLCFWFCCLLKEILNVLSAKSGLRYHLWIQHLIFSHCIRIESQCFSRAGFSSRSWGKQLWTQAAAKNTQISWWPRSSFALSPGAKIFFLFYSEVCSYLSFQKQIQFITCRMLKLDLHTVWNALSFKSVINNYVLLLGSPKKMNHL